MKKNYVIAFSGASNSFKTTTINKIKDFFGDDAVVLDEVIRKQTDLSIDEIRSDANKYVDFQIDVITQKINQESEAIQKYDSKIILVDRTLVDSLMYYLLYVDKNQLSEESLKKYSDFYHHLESAVTYSLNEVYDKIVFMFPQKPNLEDKYRTKKLAYLQKIESDTIYNLTNQYLDNLNNLILLAGDKFNFNDFFIEIKNHLTHDIIHSYGKYKNTLEDRDYIFDNIVMNSRKQAVEIDTSFLNLSNISLYLTACLFSSGKENINFSKKLFSLIKDITVDDSQFKDSLCYPTGFLDKNIPMIIGEAPGTKGRGLNESFLKPSFFFTQTSHLLRSSLFISAREFYITNAIKYAVENNKSSEKDFEKCFDILKKEIDYIQPEEIIILGNNTWNYLSENLPKKILDKCRRVNHPAAEVRRGVKPIAYVTNFQKIDKVKK